MAITPAIRGQLGHYITSEASCTKYRKTLFEHVAIRNISGNNLMLLESEVSYNCS